MTTTLDQQHAAAALHACSCGTWHEQSGHCRPEPDPADRCSCGHTRAGHAGRSVAKRSKSGWPILDDDGHALMDRQPAACSIMLCRCEIFRGEADR